MNEQTYIQKLESELSGFPENEKQDALEYVREYLMEAENKQQAMESLGTPSEYAARLREDLQGIALPPRIPESSAESAGSAAEPEKKKEPYRILKMVLAVLAGLIEVLMIFRVARSWYLSMMVVRLGEFLMTTGVLLLIEAAFKHFVFDKKEGDSHES